MGPQRVTRLRQLTPQQQRTIEALRQASRLLDSAIPVPGTTYRVGLDPIIGLIPGIGDLISPLFTIAVLWNARTFSVPKVVQLRMIVNVAIDALLGVVPLLGDLIDFAWKANDRNMALLERHAYEEHPPTAGDWGFAAIAIAIVGAVAILPFVILGWLISLL